MPGWKDYEILYDLPEGEYADPGAGGIRTRTIRSGSLLEVECYPILRLSHEAEREKRRRRTGPAQAKLNRKRSARRCMRLIEANFTRRSLVLTLTYDYGLARQRGLMNQGELLREWERQGLPLDEGDARRDFQAFLRKVKRRMPEPEALRYLYVLETTCEPRDADPCPLPPHFHFHLVIDAPGLDRERLEALWSHGFVESSRLRLGGGEAARLARYLTKREQKGGNGRRARRWSCSRNLKDPEKAARVSDRKVSRRRAAMVAADVLRDGVQILERLYPGHRCEEPPEVRYSDFVPGAYIYARMRRMRDV